MPNYVLTPESLALLAGAVLSLIFSYVPGLNSKFAGLQPEVKRSIMAGLLLVVAVVCYLLGCAGFITTGISCTQEGIVQLAMIYVLSIVANQGTFSITPQTAVVKLARPVDIVETPEQRNP